MPTYRKLYVKTTESIDLNDMPNDFTRLLWVLLPLGLCRDGRGVDNPAWIRSKIMPLRTDVELKQIAAALDWYEQREMIQRYEVDGRHYFCILSWSKYQSNTAKESPSNYPAPPKVKSESEASRELVQTNSEPSLDQVPTRSSTDVDVDANVDANVDAESDASAPSDDSPPILSSFDDWKILIKESKNRQATLLFMFKTLYPDHDPPGYGYIGKVAKRLTASRLAELLWQHSTRPPTGDVLDYVQGVAKRSASRRSGQPDSREERSKKYATDPPPDQPPPVAHTESEDRWIQVLAELRLQLTQITVDRWLADSCLLERENGRAVIQVKDEYAVEWCTGRLKKPIQRTLSGVLGEEVEVEFVAMDGGG